MPRSRQPKLATLDVAEEVARKVPGYKGYQEVTQRRDDDRRFRTSIAKHLNAEATGWSGSKASSSVTLRTCLKKWTPARESWSTWRRRSPFPLR